VRYNVILAGGGGTRLWPASRRRRPKQLLPLGPRPGETLLGATIRRLAPLADADHTMVVTAAVQAEEVARAAPEIPAANVLAEPCPRNTAAAIGLAAVLLYERDPDVLLAVLPADHHVADEDAFRAVATEAYRLAERKDAVVTVGIQPTRPETGFGYLELGPDNGAGAYAVKRFVEKPDRATAERYLREGRFLWNAGIFFFRAARILAELERHLPTTYEGVCRIAEATRKSPEAGREELQRVYAALPAVSIDYGVMERTSGILTLRGDFGWNDVGAWSALADFRPSDDEGNVKDGAVVTFDAKRNIVACDPGILVALVGVSDLVVVQAGNAVLVLPRDRAQDVREVIRLLERDGLDTYL
jgi:mannose-1-phosphate guanylyltransferase